MIRYFCEDIKFTYKNKLANNRWLKMVAGSEIRKIGDINEFHSYLGHIGCEGLFFMHQGIDRILQTLEKVAGFYVEVQCYGQKAGFPEGLLGLD